VSAHNDDVSVTIEEIPHLTNHISMRVRSNAVRLEGANPYQVTYFYSTSPAP
jgi:hypothetical protein